MEIQNAIEWVMVAIFCIVSLWGIKMFNGMFQYNSKEKKH